MSTASGGPAGTPTGPQQKVPSQDSSLVEIVRSRTALGLLSAGAGLLALAHFLSALAFIVLRTPGSTNLETAGLWVIFVGALAGLAAVSVVAWYHVLARGVQAGVELGGAVLASLLVAIGALVEAASFPGSVGGGAAVSAVGVGGWVVLALANGAKWSIREQAGATRRMSDLWLMATVGLAALAVGTGLDWLNSTGRGVPITRSLILLVGFAMLAATLIGARARGAVTGRLSTLVAGLMAGGAASVVAAIGYGLAFGASQSPTMSRVGLSLPEFAWVAVWVMLTVAAFQRYAQLSVGAAPDPAADPWAPPPAPGSPPPPYPGDPPPPPWGPARSEPAYPPPPPWGPAGPEPASPTSVPVSPTSAPAYPTWAPGPGHCTHCGFDLQPGSQFCAHCGQPVVR